MELNTINCWSAFKTLILCQLSESDNYSLHSLHFHHLWVRHIVNYIIPPHMWLRHTVRNVGPPHLGFSFLVGPPPSFLCNRSFQSYQNPDSLRVDVPVVIRAF